MSEYLFDGAETTTDLKAVYEAEYHKALAAIMRMVALSTRKSTDALGLVSMGSMKTVARLNKAAWLLHTSHGWFCAKARVAKVRERRMYDDPPVVPPDEEIDPIAPVATEPVEGP